MNKSETVRKLINEGDWKKALAFAKNFRLGVTREQRDLIVRAYECIVHPQFYKSIGKNVEECIELGKQALVSVMFKGEVA